jgi:hypothetical protein
MAGGTEAQMHRGRRNLKRIRKDLRSRRILNRMVFQDLNEVKGSAKFDGLFCDPFEIHAFFRLLAERQ